MRVDSEILKMDESQEKELLVAKSLLREDTKLLAFDEMGGGDPTRDSLTTDRGIITYDIAPKQRGDTIVIDFEELSEPEPKRQAIACCTGAMQASLRQWGRQALCVACANVYQYGCRVDCRPDVRRQMRRRGPEPFDIWRR